MSGIGLAGFGMTANILLLRKKPLGLVLAYIAVVFTCFSMAVGVWQFLITIEQLKGVARVAGILSGPIFFFIRLSLNVVYVFVLNGVRKKLAAY